MPDNLLRFILMINVTSSAFPSRDTVITLKACPGTSCLQSAKLIIGPLTVEVCAEPWAVQRVRHSCNCCCSWHLKAFLQPPDTSWRQTWSLLLACTSPMG